MNGAVLLASCSFGIHFRSHRRHDDAVNGSITTTLKRKFFSEPTPLVADGWIAAEHNIL